MAQPLLTRVLKTIKGNEILIQSDNIKAKVHFDDSRNYADYIIGQMNNEEIYKDYISGDDLVILDIGGNVGLFSLHCSDCAKVIYSFEPTSSHFALLQEFTSPYPNIIPVNIAISDRDGDISFYTNDHNTTCNSLVNTTGTCVTVKTKSIVTFLNENNITHVDFVKCDIEGSEMVALKEECVAPLFDIVDKWFIEVHSTSANWCIESVTENRNILTEIFEKVGYKTRCVGWEGFYVYKN